MTHLFEGLSVALATPFQPDASLDLEGFRRLVRHVVAGGVDVLVVLGTTGESPTLDDRERDLLIDACLEESNGRPVVVGAGSNDTRKAAALARRAQDLGAAGALIVSPYYNKPTPKGLVAHFAAVAEAAPGLPLIAYNVPGRTGVNITPAVLARLWENPQVVAVKESTANLAQIGEIARTLPEDRTLLSGDDNMALPAIAVGASGLVSVLANLVPAETKALVEAARRGDLGPGPAPALPPAPPDGRPVPGEQPHPPQDRPQAPGPRRGHPPPAPRPRRTRHRRPHGRNPRPGRPHPLRRSRLMNILAMNANELKQFFERSPEQVLSDPEAPHAHEALLEALESGRIRAAERGEDGVWRANAWVKRAILAGFRRSELTQMEGPGFPMFDKDAFPPRHFSLEDNVRLVPGGNAVRRGAHVAKGVVIMRPPTSTLAPTWTPGPWWTATPWWAAAPRSAPGSTSRRAPRSAASWSRRGAVPVVVEDETFVGGLVGLFEGIIVRRRAVLASGVIITGSTVIYDLVNSCELRREIPEGAVVVPGSRPASGGFAAKRGLCLSAPMIVKYRDDRTDAATCLEEALR